MTIVALAHAETGLDTLTCILIGFILLWETLRIKFGRKS